MAVTGFNGDNQTNIQISKSIDFSLYDENQNQIQVEINSDPIELWIPRDTSDVPSFKLVDVLNASTNITTNSNISSMELDGGQLLNKFVVNGFHLNGSNVSIHIQIKPLDKTLTYLSLLKFGYNPTLTNDNFDILKIFCPNDLIKDSKNDAYYLMFANMSKVNQFNGYVGFSLIELNTSFIDCLNKSLNTVEKLAQLLNQTSYTTNYYQRVFVSGCYYIDTETNFWSSYGVEALNDSNITHTHCQTYHLTTFAGGFIVLPPAINFNVWSQASFVQSIVITVTVIGFISIYVLLAIWTRWMDLKDSRKYGITLLPYNDFEENPINKYAYEIIVFTGTRPNSGTKSNVRIFTIV